MAKSLVLYLSSEAQPWAVLADVSESFSVRIGRGQESDLILPDRVPEDALRTVSRIHARIFGQGGECWIEDLNSHNFTFIEGKIVFAPTQAELPASIRLGAVKLRIAVEERPEGRFEGGRTPSAHALDGTLRGLGEGLSIHSRTNLWQELRGRIRWSDALFDVAELTIQAKRAEELEERLHALLALHLSAVKLAIILASPIGELARHLEECGVDPAELGRLIPRLSEVNLDTPAIRMACTEPDKALWVIPSIPVARQRASIVSAKLRSGAAGHAQSDEANAFVALAVRLAEPYVANLRELEQHRAQVRDSVPHLPSAKVQKACGERGLWGQSPQFLRSLHQAEVAATRYFSTFARERRLPAVFFLGESGTGKSALAALVHEISGRGNKPFIDMNCAAIPVTLAESELFGYEKGAHDKAFGQKPGCFEQAAGGTLFLDEIGKTTREFQSKLLTVLDSGQYMRLGGTSMRKTDCQVILAESEDPQKLVEAGSLLQELWYRTGAFCITLPPLRERREDIEILVQERLDRLNAVHPEVTPKRLRPKTLALFKAYSWPGNVRELMQCLDVAYALCPQDAEEIDVDHLPESFFRGLGMTPQQRRVLSAGIDLHRDLDSHIEALEREYFAGMIAYCEGNLTEVARRSGKSYQTVHTKLKQFRLWLRDPGDEIRSDERARLQALAGSYWQVIEREKE
ncbi:MAG: sigma 54-interacting transcriptional regulator [Candidatus Hydrogenedentes bacterium]|nr:sigma 54-interacting transcriptional regulator [Candidatus Hydrogenedentota bacterium]